MRRLAGLTLGLLAVIPAAAGAQTQPPPPPAPVPAPAPAAAVPAPAPAPTAAPAATMVEAPAEAPEPQAPAVRVGGRKLTHEYQFGLMVMPGLGYRVIFPYDDMKDCGDSSGDPTKRVCTHRVPAFLDLEFSFGVTKHFDLLTAIRLGLEDDFSHDKQFAVMPGFRYWVDPGESLKFYATLQFVYDHTPQGQQGIKTGDIAFHNGNGLMYDFVKNFGLFIQFGETLGFVRWLRFELEAGAGIQLRVP